MGENGRTVTSGLEKENWFLVPPRGEVDVSYLKIKKGGGVGVGWSKDRNAR